MTKFIRIKSGECSFKLTEEFDSVEKAANSSNEGTNAEVKIENIKLDFTTVKKEKDDKVKNPSAKIQGSSGEETQKVSGDKATS
tara:strand:- start:657 stop:908 length:252 start_codon:yes stop_codon:yes gene_type:complete